MSEKASNLPAAASAEIPQPEQRQGILFAALWTLPLAVAVCCPFTYTTRAIASVIGLGLLLLAIGHTLYSATLHRVNATLVNLIATQEIAGGILLGIWLLGEYPDFNTLDWYPVGVVKSLIIMCDNSCPFISKIVSSQYLTVGA